MNQTTRNASMRSYKKFHFSSVEAAEKAIRIMQTEFPTEIFKISSVGSIFYRTNGSLLYDMRIRDLAHSLGGVDP